MSGTSSSLFSPALLEAYVSSLKEGSLPGVWSKAVALSREASFQLDRATDSELIIRVILKGRPVHPRVTLWPTDEDAYCDCGDRNDPCAHIGAAALALKSGQILTEVSADPSVTPFNGISYRFLRKEKTLELQRWVIAGSTSGATSPRESLLSETLVGFIGGIQAGQIAHPTVAATQEDFAIDQLVGARSSASLDRNGWARLLKLLEPCPDVRLDNVRIRTSPQLISVQLELLNENGGYRLRRRVDPAVSQAFSPGLALCGEILHPVRDPELSDAERELIRGEGTFFSQRDTSRLLTEVLPELKRKLQVAVLAEKLPELRELAPKILLEADNEGDDELSVVADLIYGEPAIARVRLDQPGAPLESLSRQELPLRNFARERELVRALQSEMHLQPGQRVRLQGDAAAEFLLRAQGGGTSAGSDLQLRHTFTTPPIHSALRADFQFGDRDFDVAFTSADSPEGSSSDPKPGTSPGASMIDPARVFQAWRENRSYVPLMGGGWAPLPLDWLTRYGERILRLIEAREHSSAKSKSLPSYLLPEALDLCDEQGVRYSESLQRLKRSLQDFTRIPECPMPEDLRAEPRSYQRQGIYWLSFLRDQGMGAILADDMGLGKTLQALCAIRGRTLIVCPTSVISSWIEQIARFRPSLRAHLYHGTARRMDASATVILTTYGILRQDRERLADQKWESIVLDEAHLIKNPDSQIARAAHALRGGFRIALSGTPVENRLDDLWSQFQFVNPGLLGTRADFQDSFSAPLSRGDRNAEAKLRSRIRPFLLRRLKKEVAPELPPRTEVTLHCELQTEERDLYDSLLAMGRSEVLRELEQGGSVIAALETLLRLRQACCHPALLPGQQIAPGHSSSKTTLLLETLTESIDLGHRSLIFSQWTSYLNLLEPLLTAAGIAFLRLDGSTTNRQEIVSAFQNPAGPPVLLLSLKAGGVGLTLTAADHVFLMDPWWNPAVEDQAADRAHRIGQTNPVLIHRMVAKDTIEDRILQLQREKMRLSDTVLEGSAGAASLTREDLMSLLN